MIQINDTVRLDEVDCDCIVMKIEHNVYARNIDVFTVTYHVINKNNYDISAVVEYGREEFLKLAAKKEKHEIIIANKSRIQLEDSCTICKVCGRSLSDYGFDEFGACVDCQH